MCGNPDPAAQSKYRSLWEQYYSDVQGVIWVVDATDRIRMCVVRDELEYLLEHKSVKNVSFPILFCANKVRTAEMGAAGVMKSALLPMIPTIMHCLFGGRGLWLWWLGTAARSQ